MAERGRGPRETGLDVLGNSTSVAPVGAYTGAAGETGRDPRGIEEAV